MVIDFNIYTFLILFFTTILAAFIIYKRKERKIKFFVITIILLYIFLLIQVTIFPIWILGADELNKIHDQYGKYIKYYQLIPFKTIKSTMMSLPAFIKQDIGNILLLLPIPIFIGFLKEKNSVLKMFVFGFCTSLFIELAQLLINVLTKYPVHLCDVDDLILNSMSVILGIIVFHMIKAINPAYSFMHKLISVNR